MDTENRAFLLHKASAHSQQCAHKRCALLVVTLLVGFCVSAPNLHCQEAPDELLHKAATLSQAKKYAEAISVYEHLIAAHPSCAEAYRGIVTCYTELGNPHGALKYMDSLFLEHPDRAEVNYGMGLALYAVGKYDRAAACFKKAITLKPDLAPAWNNAAVIEHFINRNYAAARQYYEKAIAISTQTGNKTVADIARKNLENLPRPEDVRVMSLEEFINTFIARAESRDETGMRHLVLSQKQNSEQALDWLLSAALRAHAAGATAEETTSANLAKLLAGQYAAVHASDLLQKKYKEYASLDPAQKKTIAQAEVQLARGLDLEQQNRMSEAAQAYEEASLLFERGGRRQYAARARLCVGDVYRATKEYRRAREAYSSALTTFIELRDEPHKALALASLGIAESLLGNRDDALDFLNRALTIYVSLNDEQAAAKVRKNIETVRTQHNRVAPGS